MAGAAGPPSGSGDAGMPDPVAPDAVPAAPISPDAVTPGSRVARASAAGQQLAGNSAEQLATLVERVAPALGYLGRHLRRAARWLTVLIILVTAVPAWLWFENQGTPGAIVIALIGLVGIVAAWVPAWACWRAHRAMGGLAAGIRVMPGESTRYLTELSGTLNELSDKKGSTFRNTFRLRHLRNLTALAERVGLDDIGAIATAPGLAFGALCTAAVVFALLAVAALTGLAANVSA